MFDKPIYSMTALLRDLYKMGKGAPDLFDAVLSGRIDGAFREKILLAATAFNRCRYCAFVHAHWALWNKVDLAEIKALLHQEENYVYDRRERVALDFARHYAATRGEPDERRLAQLRDYYGTQKADDMLAFLRMIFFANVAGNTFDSFLARLRGQGAPEGNLISEWLVFQVAAPILLPVLVVLTLRRLIANEPEGIMAAVPV